MSEETKKTPRTISRREFLRDASIVVGGTAVSSAFFLSACGEEIEVTKTVTTTAPGSTSTVTTTAPGSTVTKTAADNTVTVTKYTCPICSQEFDSLEALKAHFDSVHEGAASVAENVVNITVNGNSYKVTAQPTDTLREVLREQLGLTSIKDMCNGYGACGSCTVIKDGRPILSCMTLALTCNGAIIETTEGIARDNHPLIDAYINDNCMQCGYCTPGFVITAKALLDKNSNPTEGDIKEALSGNLCRCGTYPHHIPAILSASRKQ